MKFSIPAYLILVLFAQTLFAADMTLEERDAMFNKYAQTLAPSQNMTYDQLVAMGKQMNHVITLGGYSGQGYQNPDAVRSYLKNVMTQAGDGAMYVIGGTEDGIGAGYKMIPEIAKELGFKNIKTAGIVSRNAAKYGIAPMDANVFVNTRVNDWNVKGPDGKSLMVKIAKDTGGQMVYAKGGDVSAAELKEAAAEGVPVTVLRDPSLSASEAVAAKKLAKAHPSLDPAGPEFKAKLAETMAAADKPTADLQKSAVPGMKFVETPRALSIPRSTGSSIGGALSRGLGAASSAIRSGFGKLSLASSATGFIRGAVDQQTDEAFSKGKCPPNFANSRGSFESLAKYDSATWDAVAKDCKANGNELDFSADAKKLKGENKGGVARGTCQTDGTVKIVHNENGMASTLKFSSENELSSITTTPAGDKSGAYSITYYKDPKQGWRVSTTAKQKDGSTEKNDESWNSYVSRYACSLEKCKNEDLQASVEKIDELTTSFMPFGFVTSEYSVKAAASLNLTRRILLGGKSAQPSFTDYCKLVQAKGAPVPQDVVFTDSSAARQRSSSADGSAHSTGAPGSR